MLFGIWNALKALNRTEGILLFALNRNIRMVDLKPERVNILFSGVTKCGRGMALMLSICFPKIPERRPARHGTRRFKEVLRS